MNTTDAIERAANAGITHTRAALILLYLARQSKPVRQRDVLAATGLPKPAITRHTERLEELGLIAKWFPTPTQDGRAMFFQATDKGRALAMSIDPAIKPVVAAA